MRQRGRERETVLVSHFKDKTICTQRRKVTFSRSHSIRGGVEFVATLAPAFLVPSEMDTSHWRLGSLGRLEEVSLEGMSLLNCFTHYYQKVWGDWRLTCCPKQARLVERKVCFTSDTGNWSGGGHLPKGWLPTLPGNQWGKSFYRQKEGATCIHSTVRSDSCLQISHRWADQPSSWWF